MRKEESGASARGRREASGGRRGLLARRRLLLLLLLPPLLSGVPTARGSGRAAAAAAAAAAGLGWRWRRAGTWSLRAAGWLLPLRVPALRSLLAGSGRRRVVVVARHRGKEGRSSSNLKYPLKQPQLPPPLPGINLNDPTRNRSKARENTRAHFWGEGGDGLAPVSGTVTCSLLKPAIPPSSSDTCTPASRGGGRGGHNCRDWSIQNSGHSLEMEGESKGPDSDPGLPCFPRLLPRLLQPPPHHC